MKNLYVLLFLFLFIFILGCSQQDQGRITLQRTGTTAIQTFEETGNDICTTPDGKPIIRMFSTSWCPHCNWIRQTYKDTVNSYGDSIEAYLWEVDTNDDLLTPQHEPIPQTEMDIFTAYNPEGSIPTFIFGCTYLRVGNGYESEDNLEAETNEFKAVIDNLLAQ